MNDTVSLFPIDSCFQFNFAYRKQIPLTGDRAGAFTSGLHFWFFQKQFCTRRDLRDDPVQGANWSCNFDLQTPQPAVLSF